MLESRPNEIRFRVTSSTFLKERVGEICLTLFKEPAARSVLKYESILALGCFLSDAMINSPLMTNLFGGVAIGFLPLTSPALYKTLSSYSMFEAYPQLKWRDVDKESAQRILGDGVRAWIAGGEKGTWRVFPYSLVGYKKRLIDELGKRVRGLEQAASLIDIMLNVPDPELKLFCVKAVERYGKPYLRQQILDQIEQNNQEKTELERVLYRYLAWRWKLVNNKELEKEEKLALLETNSIFKTATDVATQIVEVLRKEIPFENTLIPFIRLYTLRRIKEETNKNRIPSALDKDLVSRIREELVTQLAKSKRAEKEATYDPESPTIGLEIEPDTFRSKPTMTLLCSDMKDIRRVIKYAGLGSQRGYPFEIVLSPTRSPIIQLLLLREIVILTGIPIEYAGIQINFGGFGKIPTIPLALQRMILASGRLYPPSEYFENQGAFWDAGARLNPATKGEISTRSLTNPLTHHDVKKITPEDSLHPEFKTVSELRATVGAPSFFIFARGLIAAYHSASLAKAYERQLSGRSLSNREIQMAQKWEIISARFNQLLQTLALPKIDQNWTNEDWKRFALFSSDEGRLTTNAQQILATEI